MKSPLKEIPAGLRQLIETENTLALATVDAQGQPAIAPLFYIADERLHLYWLSARTARHSRHLRAHPETELAVFHSTTDWRAIRGAQCRGTVAVVTGARRQALLARYAERFGLGPTFQAAIRRSSLYEFRPAWIRYVDNSAGFGNKIELKLGADAHSL
jgi:uncharacterized protein YhbP (UPF0306 family)